MISHGSYSDHSGIPAKQRRQHTAPAKYTINSDSYAEGLITPEDDKLSDFKNLSDITFSYGQNLLANRKK
jgi:hypothetical protein